MEKVLQETFWTHFFGHPYHWNGTKIPLDAKLWTKRPFPFLSKPTQKSINQLSWICTSMQKTSVLEAANFRVPWSDWSHPFLTMPTQKNFDWLLIFVNLYQHAKNQFIPTVYSLETVNLKVPSHDWPHPSSTMRTPKTFKLIFMKLYQHGKNKLIPLVNSSLESSDHIGHINKLKMRLIHQFAQEK